MEQEEEMLASEPTITLQQEEPTFEAPPVYQEKVQRESTVEDYWNTVNPAALPFNNPELRYDWKTDYRGSLGFDDEDFQAVYKASDIETQRVMLKANNKSDALKIAARRSIFVDSQKAIEQDGILTQLGMGVLPALASPTTLLPIGAVFKGAQAAKTVNRLQSAGIGFGVGGAVGAIANMADEALFDLQGMPTNYLGAAGIGMAFGGGLGLIGGALSGPTQKSIANSLDPKNDTFSMDYTNDPILSFIDDGSGIPKIKDVAQMDKTLLDKVPFLGKWLRSDVHTVYQSNSDILRGLMTRLSDATIALKDNEGNIAVTGKTAKNYQRELKGIHNNLTDEISQLHGQAKLNGYTGNIEEFNEDIWGVLIKELNNQKSKANEVELEYDKVNLGRQQQEEIALTKDIEQRTTEFDKGAWYYRDAENKLQPITPEDIKVIEANDAAKTEYTKQVAEVEAKNKLLDEERAKYIEDNLAQYKLEGVVNKDEIKELAKTLRETIDELIPREDMPVKPDYLPAKKLERRLPTQKEKAKFEADIKKEVQARLDEELKLKEEYMNNFYNDYKVKFEDTPLGKGAESHKVYFQRMLQKGQELKLEGLNGINPNKLYVPRTYNYKGIHKGSVSQATVQAEVRAGIEHDVRNKGMNAVELNEAVAYVVKMLNESVFDLNNLTTSFMVKGLPFGGRLKKQKLYLNETYMPNVLNNNLGDLTGAYHYQMQGRQGLQFAFGTDKPTDIMEAVKQEHLSKGVLYAPEEVQAFERVVKDVVGDLRMNQLADTPAWTFVRNLGSYNTLRQGGGFGGNQFIELMSSIVMQGTKALLTGRLFKSLKSSSDLMFKGKGTNDEFSQFLINSGFMENTLHTSRINRFGDSDSGFNSGWLENKLNFLNDKLMKYNGMRYFLGVMEDYTGAAIITQIKTGNMPLKRLARWGLSEQDAANLQVKLRAVTKEDSWDLSKLSKKERDQVQLAIVKGIEEIVVQGDSIHLPNWMKAPGPFAKVLTQFMRFPMIAQETLLRRGMSDEQAQLVSGTLSSIVTYMGIKYLREEAAVSLGTVQEIDRKYNYENFSNDEWMRVIGESLNYTAPLGMMSSVWNYGAIATGKPELGREWQSKNGMMSLLGPSGGLGEDLIQLMRAGVEGDLRTERDFKRFRSLVPFMNLPLIKEGTDIIIEELGD